MTPQEIVDKIDEEVPYKMFHELKELVDAAREDEALLYLQSYFNCADDIAKAAFALYKETLYAESKKIEEETRAPLTPERVAQDIAAAKDLLNKPKCPICQSTNLKKISNWSKSLASMHWGELAAGMVAKTWHCNNCDSEW